MIKASVQKTIDESLSGKRLDKFIKSAYSKFKRDDIKESIACGLITVNSKALPPHYHLKSGDVVSGDIKTFGAVKLRANNDVSLEIANETEDFIIINKPAGVVSTPDKNHENDSLVSGLLARYPQMMREFKGAAYLGLVHRLDKGASGLLIAAKNMAAFKELREMLQLMRIRKTYYVLVQGRMKKSEGKIVAPLTKVKDGWVVKNIPSADPDTDDSKPAVTKFKVMKKFNKATYLNVQIVTGRTHQIRAHFAAVDHPVVGDALYGFDAEGFEKAYQIIPSRLILHAQGLSFFFSGKRYTFVKNPPEDFMNIIFRCDSLSTR